MLLLNRQVHSKSCIWKSEFQINRQTKACCFKHWCMVLV